MSNPWDQRYSASENYYGDLPNDHLKKASSYLSKNSKILSLGEGEGRNALYLLKQGHDITATDLSSVGLNKLKTEAQKLGLNVETIVGDLNHFDFGKNKWDGIISIWCHTPKELREKIHRHVVEALKPNGIFILEAYTPEQLKYKTGGPPVPELMMTAKDLEVDLKGLEIIQLEEKIREVQEGKGHHGTSSVVQVIARKLP